MLDQGQTLSGADVEDSEVGNNSRNTAGAGEGECAVAENLGVALLIGVLLKKAREISVLSSND